MYRVLVDGELLCDSRIDELAIINPVVKNRVNSAGSFNFTIAPEHPKKDLIKRRLSIISVYVDDETEPVFQGIVTEENTDFFNQKNYICEGELSYFNDSIQRQAHYQGLSVRQLLETYINVHNSQVEANKRFEVGMVTVDDLYITCFTNMEPTMKSIKEDLLDDLGGYIRIRYADNHKYIDYLAESPHTSEQIIELGKNLIDYSSNIDNTQIATSIIPQGARLETQTVPGLEARVDIKSVNDGKDYIYLQNAVDNYGWITQVVTWDDVTQPANLKTKGEQYLAETQFENVVIKASAVDFGLLSSRYDRFKLLDQIRVVSPVHGMNRYFILTEQTLNLNEPEKDTVVLGTNEKLSLSSRTLEANKDVMNLISQVPTTDFINSAIANATNLITGVEGGHVKIKRNEDGKPEEILIMDTEDEATATKIWRWNLNGWGYSSDGGQTYALAATMDGSIVADMIKTGVLKAVRYESADGLFFIPSDGGLYLKDVNGNNAVKIQGQTITVYDWNESGKIGGQINSVRSASGKSGILIAGNRYGSVELGLRNENSYDPVFKAWRLDNGGWQSRVEGTEAVVHGSNTYIQADNGISLNKVPTITGTASGTMFPTIKGGGVTVNNGLITNWNMGGYSGVVDDILLANGQKLQIGFSDGLCEGWVKY